MLGLLMTATGAGALGARFYLASRDDSVVGLGRVMHVSRRSCSAPD